MRLLLWLAVPGVLCGQDLGVGERVRLAARWTVGPVSLFTTAAGSGIQHWRDTPGEWGQGMAGFGRRFGWHALGNAAGNAMEQTVGALVHEDPRYRQAAGRRFWGRVAHVVAGTFTAPDTRGGGTRFALARMVGAYGAGFLSNAWYPAGGNSAGEALLRGTLSLGADMGANAFQEFWPEVKRRVLGRP